MTWFNLQEEIASQFSDIRIDYKEIARENWLILNEPERKLKDLVDWKIANPVQVKLYRKRYNERNASAKAAYDKKYRAENRDAINAKRRARRAAKRAAS